MRRFYQIEDSCGRLYRVRENYKFAILIFDKF